MSYFLYPRFFRSHRYPEKHHQPCHRRQECHLSFQLSYPPKNPQILRQSLRFLYCPHCLFRFLPGNPKQLQPVQPAYPDHPRRVPPLCYSPLRRQPSRVQPHTPLPEQRPSLRCLLCFYRKCPRYHSQTSRYHCQYCCLRYSRFPAPGCSDLRLLNRCPGLRSPGCRSPVFLIPVKSYCPVTYCYPARYCHPWMYRCPVLYYSPEGFRPARCSRYFPYFRYLSGCYPESLYSPVPFLLHQRDL